METPFCGRGLSCVAVGAFDEGVDHDLGATDGLYVGQGRGGVPSTRPVSAGLERIEVTAKRGDCCLRLIVCHRRVPRFKRRRPGTCRESYDGCLVIVKRSSYVCFSPDGGGAVGRGRRTARYA